MIFRKNGGVNNPSSLIQDGLNQSDQAIDHKKPINLFKMKKTRDLFDSLKFKTASDN